MLRGGVLVELQPLEEAGEVRDVSGVPAGDEGCEASHADLLEPAHLRVPPGGEGDQARPMVGRIACHRHQAVPLQLLHVPGDQGGADLQGVGDIGRPAALGAREGLENGQPARPRPLTPGPVQPGVDGEEGDHHALDVRSAGVHALRLP